MSVWSGKRLNWRWSGGDSEDENLLKKTLDEDK